MRDSVALGYVVLCDLRCVNGTLGFRTVVESQYPMTLVHGTIEKVTKTISKEAYFLHRHQFPAGLGRPGPLPVRAGGGGAGGWEAGGGVGEAGDRHQDEGVGRAGLEGGRGADVPLLQVRERMFWCGSLSHSRLS